MDTSTSKTIARLTERIAALEQKEREQAQPDAQWVRSISRRGMLAAAAGATAVLASRAMPAAAADGDPLLMGEQNEVDEQTIFNYTGNIGAAMWISTDTGVGCLIADCQRPSANTVGVIGKAWSPTGTGVLGWEVALSGNTFGVRGEVASTSGRAIQGIASATSGSAFGVRGESNSTSGIGVAGTATAGSGRTYGVHGQSNSPGGYGVFSQGRFKSTGRSFLGAPNSAPANADVSNGSITFYLDQPNNKLKVRVRYANGTLKTASINLA